MAKETFEEVVSIPEEFTFGQGGWVRYLNSELPVSVLVRFVDRGGRLVAADVLVADPLEGGLNATTFRAVPLAHIEAEVNKEPELLLRKMRFPGPAVRQVASQGFGGGLGDSASLGTATIIHTAIPPPTLDVPTETHGRGHSYPPEFYVSVAEVYRELVDAGVRNPVGRIADENRVPLSRVKGWVREARNRGHLPKASHGKAG